MGYRVKPSGQGFKVLFETQGVRRQARGVPKSEWASIGFRADMSMDEAKDRARQLNAADHLRRIEKKRNAIQARLSEDRLVQQVFLPLSDREEFERTKLNLEKSKARSYWACAARIISEVRLEPKDWEANSEAFYKAFVKRRMSPSYVRSVLPIINDWGAFIARKRGSFFLPIPYPKRRGWNKEIAEAYFQKPHTAGNKESAPLTPSLLASREGALKSEQARWLRRTVWFGVRPVEADLLSQPTGKRTWWVTREQGVQVLWIYQTKLKGLHPDKRVKYIPCICPEQVAALREVGLPATRPLQKTMRNHFGGTITLYGGRKGFIELMRGLGQEFQDISAWLGHTDVSRTYQSYYRRNAVSFKKTA